MKKKMFLALMIGLAAPYGYIPMQMTLKENQQTNEEREAKLEKAEAKRKRKREKKAEKGKE